MHNNAEADDLEGFSFPLAWSGYTNGGSAPLGTNKGIKAT